MSFGSIIFKLCCNIFSFIFDRLHKEYDFISRGKRREFENRDKVRDASDAEDVLANLIAQGDSYVFEDKIYTWLRIPFIVDLQHIETFVKGLNSLHIIKFYEFIGKNGQKSTAVNFEASHLQLNIFAFGKLLSIEQLLTFEALLDHCKVYTMFNVDNSTNINMQCLRIEEFKGININITGFGCLSWPLSKFSTLLAKLNTRMLRNLVEYRIENYVGHLISHCRSSETEEFHYSDTVCCEKLSCKNSSLLHNVFCRATVGANLKKANSKKNKLESSRELRSSSYKNIAPERNTLDNTFDDNIEFKFSEDNTDLNDVKALSTLDMNTCCVFFKIENEYHDTLAKDKCSSSDSKEFLKSLFSSNIGGESKTNKRTKLSDRPDEQSRREDKIRNEKSLDSFVKQYPNFILLTHNSSEKQLSDTEESKSCKGAWQTEIMKHKVECSMSTDKSRVRNTRPIKQGLGLKTKQMKNPVIRKHKVIKRNKTFSEKYYMVGDEKKIVTNTAGINVMNKPNLEQHYRLHASEELKSYARKYSTKQNVEISKPNKLSGFETSEITGQQIKLNGGTKECKDTKTRNTFSSNRKKVHQSDDNDEIHLKMLKLNSKKTSVSKKEISIEDRIRNDFNMLMEMNVIGDEICRHFENPWIEPVSDDTFFFADRGIQNYTPILDLGNNEIFESTETSDSLDDRTYSKQKTNFSLGNGDIQKSETFFIAQNDTKQSAEWDPCPQSNNSSIIQYTNLNPLQSENASSNTYEIAQIVKRFFEQNPVEVLMERNAYLTDFVENDDYLNFSTPLNTDLSDISSDQKVYLDDEPYQKTSSPFERKLSLELKDANKAEGSEVRKETIPEMNKTEVYGPDSMYLDDSSGSISSYADIQNVTKSSALKIQLSTTNSTNNADSIVGRHDNGGELVEESNEIFNSSLAMTSEYPSGNQLLINPKGKICSIDITSKKKPNNENEYQYSFRSADAFISAIRVDNKVVYTNDSPLSNEAVLGSSEAINLDEVEKFLIENIQLELESAALKDEISTLIKEAAAIAELDNKADLGLSNEDSYEIIRENLITLISEDYFEDSLPDMENQNSSGRKNDEICVTENKQSLLQQDLKQKTDEDMLETNIEVEFFDYIKNQTKCLTAMFEAFRRKHEERKNTNSETIYIKPYFKSLDEGWRFDSGKLNVTEIPNAVQDDNFKVDDNDGWSSENRCGSPWEDCKIVDTEGRVTWRKALEIWGC